MEIYFDLDLSPLIVAIVATAVVAAVYIATSYRHRVQAVVSHARRHKRLSETDIPKRFPSLSVVVYDRDSAEQLGRLLPELLDQNYPGEMEVIVVIDGKSDAADNIITRLSVDHTNLRVTFVPDDAHAISRKKLALTLGIKAARHDYVLLTDANAQSPSYDWLATMARHFAGGKEVVIGASHAVDRDGRSGSAILAFDALRDTVTYLSAAASRRPYRACPANFAFRRRLFFDSKGFASSVAYHHGEDDIFISLIANGSNTALELSPQARVAIATSDLKAYHRYDRARHMFTGRYVSRRSRYLFGAGSVAIWLWIAATVAAGIVAAPNMLPLTIALGAGIVAMTLAAIAWRSAGKTLGIAVRGAALPFAMIWRPFTTLAYRLRSRANAQRNYTWAKP